MIFEENKSLENLGRKTGYVAGYVVFTSFLFLILSFLQRLPADWSYLHVAGITALIAATSTLLKRWLG